MAFLVFLEFLELTMLALKVWLMLLVLLVLVCGCRFFFLVSFFEVLQNLYFLHLSCVCHAVQAI